MALQVAELSLELIETLRPLMPRIKQRDKSLADQILRAANSIALNVGEAELSDPGNRRARFFTAGGKRGGDADGGEGSGCLAVLHGEGWGGGRRLAPAAHRDSLEADEELAREGV